MTSRPPPPPPAPNPPAVGVPLHIERKDFPVRCGVHVCCVRTSTLTHRLGASDVFLPSPRVVLKTFLDIWNAYQTLFLVLDKCCSRMKSYRQDSGGLSPATSTITCTWTCLFPSKQQTWVLGSWAQFQQLYPWFNPCVGAWGSSSCQDPESLLALQGAVEEEYAAQPFCVTNHGSTLAVTSQWIKQLEAPHSIPFAV